MCTVCRRGVFIHRWVLILLVLVLLVRVMMAMMMMVVAIRQRSITQERSHRQLVVKFHIHSSSHINGRRELAEGNGKVESMMLLMLMRVYDPRVAKVDAGDAVGGSYRACSVGG